MPRNVFKKCGKGGHRRLGFRSFKSCVKAGGDPARRLVYGTMNYQEYREYKAHQEVDSGLRDVQRAVYLLGTEYSGFKRLIKQAAREFEMTLAEEGGQRSY